MALTEQARTYYKSLLDNTQDENEREELLEGIKSHHSNNNYLSKDRNALRVLGQKSMGRYREPFKRTVPMQENDSDFIPGIKRGLQNLQSSAYGAEALVGSGLERLGFEETGKKLQDIGMEGYQRNVEEAEQYPKKHSFKDIYTGKTGVGGAIDWAQGTLGELIPSMAEAAIGALAGTLVAPGPGTVAGGLASRTLLKTAINKGITKFAKAGMDKAAKDQLRKQVTKQALKKFGGKVGIGAAVMPVESGSSYGDLLESHGIDAPETALLFGALKTSLEFFGGNSKLVDVFVDSLTKGSTGLIKKSAKELLKNIPQEALQEGGQEVFDILNTVVNTDEKLFTIEHLEEIIESMAAGAIGGGTGAITTTMMNPKEGTETNEINQQAENIISNGTEVIQTAITNLDKDLNNFNLLLNDPEVLKAKAAELDISVDELTTSLNDQIEMSTQLQTLLKEEVGLDVASIDEEEILEDDTEIETDIETKSEDDIYWDQQEKEVKDQLARQDKLKDLRKSLSYQIQEGNQEEINKLWKLYEKEQAEEDSRKAQKPSPDLAGQERQKQIDNLYWPAEQELDEKHNNKIQQLKELVKNPEERIKTGKIISNFYQRISNEKEKSSGDIPILESGEVTDPRLIEVPAEQELNTFLTRAIERLGGKVEPSVIFDKEIYRREVLAEQENDLKDKPSPFTNEQQVEEGQTLEETKESALEYDENAEVIIKVVNEDGLILKIKQTAKEAIVEIDEQIATYKALLECI